MGAVKTVTKSVTVTHTDDVTGEQIKESQVRKVNLIDPTTGERRTLDMSPATLKEYKKVLDTYVKASRPVSAGKSVSRSDAGQIRTWGRANGHDVPERGRLPLALIEAFNAAQGGEGAPEQQDTETVSE